ncbi:MAG: hypothetical protein ACYTEQ_09295 [Planctomycetota bacterium]|jgi:hypothetical protein
MTSAEIGYHNSYLGKDAGLNPLDWFRPYGGYDFEGYETPKSIQKKPTRMETAAYESLSPERRAHQQYNPKIFGSYRPMRERIFEMRAEQKRQAAHAEEMGTQGAATPHKDVKQDDPRLDEIKDRQRAAQAASSGGKAVDTGDPDSAWFGAGGGKEVAHPGDSITAAAAKGAARKAYGWATGKTSEEVATMEENAGKISDVLADPETGKILDKVQDPELKAKFNKIVDVFNSPGGEKLINYLSDTISDPEKMGNLENAVNSAAEFGGAVSPDDVKNAKGWIDKIKTHGPGIAMTGVGLIALFMMMGMFGRGGGGGQQQPVIIQGGGGYGPGYQSGYGAPWGIR